MRLKTFYHCLFWLALVIFCAAPSYAQGTDANKPITIGFLQVEAAQYEAEWRMHTGYYPTLAKAGMQGALVERGPLQHGPLAPGQLYQQIKPFHAIVLASREESIDQMTDQDRQRAEIARDDLVRYVKEGGGVFFHIQAVRYPRDDDEKFFNILLEPFGARILHEGVYDKQTAFASEQTSVFAPMQFFTTSNIKPHPVTQGVRGLALPMHGSETIPGVEAYSIDNNWEVVVAGEQTAKSYFVGDDNGMKLDREGTYGTTPPIAAVRTFEKGRAFIYSTPEKHAFLNYGNKMWPQITESEGDKATGKPSDSNTMMLNALRWLGEGALSNPELGNHKLAPIEPVTFPATINWDEGKFPIPAPGIRGVLGAHSNYSDGKGTVAEYAKAAQAAGLSYITFTDPLELLTAEKLEKLKQDCAAASSDTFYACPGIEFTDSLGVRWATWGERVIWPEKTFTDKEKQFTVWDGQRMYSTGRYAAMCGYSPNAIVDYKALHAANATPVNLWWFSRIFPYSYEIENNSAKLLADNFDEYLFALRDLRYIAIDSYTRLRSPQQVALAARTCTTSMHDLPSAKSLLSARLTSMYESANAVQQVSQGPRILQWATINNQMETPWQITHGAQRIRLRFEVGSDTGISEVKVHDANYGIVRRFAGNGAKTLAREFEMVHDKQHYLVLEVIDTKGKRAISPYQFLFCYKSGLYRCGDNLNLLGSAQLVWHPDRNEMPAMVKYFENGFKYTVQGIDSGPPLATQPSFWALDYIQTPAGISPEEKEDITNKILDVKQGSTDLQIYSTEMTHRSEKYDTDKRPTPALGPIAKRIEPLEYFERSQTTYAPASREDYFLTWNHRRPYEGSENYRGSILWHEGEVRFKKDVTLSGDVPVPFFVMRGPNGGGAKFKLYDHFFVTDKKDGVLSVQLAPDQKDPLRKIGKIRPGGYCAAMNTDLGYYGFFASSDRDFTYSTASADPTKVGQIVIGLGTDGQQVKAGTIWKYRFATATIADQATDNKLLEDMARAQNFDGGTAGYPYQVKTGRFENAEYFFTVQAAANEAEFSIGPRSMICDLPIRVRGLQDNGCAAVYVKNRDFFRFIAVTDSTGYFQEPTETASEMWVGNVFVSSDKNLKMTLTVDGQSAGKEPQLEIHNPTTKNVKAEISSPPNTPRFGGMKADVTVPAGTSNFFRILDGKLVHGSQ